MKKRSVLLGYVIGVITTILVAMLVLNITNYRILTESRYEKLSYMTSKYSKVEKLKNELLEYYYKDIDEELLFDGMYKGLFEATGDKYTKYLNKEEYDNYNQSTSGKYVGIGILSDLSDDTLRIKRVFPDSPAKKSGVLPGDLIISVDGVHIDDVGNYELIDLMLGEDNTNVSITILRANKEIKMVIRRGKIEIPFVDSSNLDGVGYIYIYKFGTGVAKEFKNHLNDLIKDNIRSLIVDVRDNPGGLVSESTKIADELMSESIMVYTLNKKGEKKEYISDSKKINIPYVILINEHSASASEILAGAIKGSSSGKVIGSQSFGKGVIQSVNDFHDGTGYKITHSEYFTPSDENIHGIGIKPDYQVEYLGIIEGDKPNLELDLQLIKAIEILNN